MFSLDDGISVVEYQRKDGLMRLDITSENGLCYTIVDNFPDETKTYLQLTYENEFIFNFYIDKFKDNSVFDIAYFKETKHHYLFRMDSVSLKKFLYETDRCISVPFSERYKHYLYINGKKYELNFVSHRLHVTSNVTYSNENKERHDQKWLYTYNEVIENRITKIVYNHSKDRYTFDGYPRASHYGHYQIIGDHFQLIGIFNGHFQEIFSLRYSPKTLELHLNDVNNQYTYLTNQSSSDFNNVLKNQVFQWLSDDGDRFVKDALKNYDFNEMILDDALQLLEMALI